MKGIWRWLDDQWWSICAIGLSLFQLGQAIALNRWTVAGYPRPTLAAAAAGLIFGFAAWRKLSWARWAGMAWIALLIVVGIMNVALNGWTTERAIYLLGMILMAVGLWIQYFVFREHSSDNDGDSRPFLSLVLLMREPRFLDGTVLASLATRAWDIEIVPRDPDDEGAEEVDDEDERTGLLMGEPPLFFGIHPHAIFAVHCRDVPYFDEPEKAAEAMLELRARQAIENHNAWIAVDVVHWHGPEEATEGAYRLIARLLAELADDNVLAVFDPEAGQIFCYDPETEQKLRSDNPLAELRQAYYAPVIQIDNNDPLMQEAIEEARREWPKFVAAFESRDTEDEKHLYAVKARFGDGDHVEHMWLQVTGIENDVIYGRLDNDPANLPHLAAGDTVRIPAGEISDWMCVVNDEVSGGYSLKVIQQRTKEAREKASGNKVDGD